MLWGICEVESIMTKLFIDCGYYRGMVQDFYRKAGILDDSWEIVAFEASPEIDVPDWVIKKAVWVHDKGVEFQMGGRNDAGSITGTSGHGDPRLYKVPSFDFSEYVSKLGEYDYILCSFDIEGAEFTVLEKMLEDGSIDRIDYLDLEFHHRLMESKNQDDAQVLINKILSRGVGIRLKVPLN